MIGFVQVAAPAFVAVVIVLFVIVVIGTYLFIVKPILDWATRPGGGFFRRVVFWPVRRAATAVERFVKEQIHALARFVLANDRPAVIFFDQLAELAQRLAGTLGDMSEQTWRALWTLRHVTVPALITAALVPLKAQLTRHTNRLDALEDLNRRVAVVVGTGLRSLPWGAPGTYVGNFDQWWNSYRHLWAQTFGTLMPRVNELWANRVESLRDRFNELETRVTLIREEALPAIRQRIGRIEDALGDLLTDPTTWLMATLGLSLVPILSPAATRLGLGNLFCRNTQDVASRLCRTDADLLAQLLAGTLIWALVVDPRVLARSAEVVTGGLGDVIRATVIR